MLEEYDESRLNALSYSAIIRLRLESRVWRTPRSTISLRIMQLDDQNISWLHVASVPPLVLVRIFQPVQFGLKAVRIEKLERLEIGVGNGSLICHAHRISGNFVQGTPEAVGGPSASLEFVKVVGWVRSSGCLLQTSLRGCVFPISVHIVRVGPGFGCSGRIFRATHVV